MGQIILAVDDQGNFLEYIPKDEGHTGNGKRHLAITVLIYNNKGEVLLQRRKHKVFDNIWDFTASTHPLHLEDGTDESLEQATLRALKYEYDIDVDYFLTKRDNISLKNLGSFNYFAQIGNLCENEHDHLLIGEYNGEIKLNPAVGYEYKWVKKEDFFEDINKSPQKYTPWAIEAAKPLKGKLP
ncbi:NUDIX domain-containing protein [Candidatus Daviesbacteria bacterium]|nr:NUDIX domain-containing protein [Candidatus Daviesbacteria bacterium]